MQRFRTRYLISVGMLRIKSTSCPAVRAYVSAPTASPQLILSVCVGTFGSYHVADGGGGVSGGTHHCVLKHNPPLRLQRNPGKTSMNRPLCVCGCVCSATLVYCALLECVLLNNECLKCSMENPFQTHEKENHTLVNLNYDTSTNSDILNNYYEMKSRNSDILNHNYKIKK